MRYLLNYTFDGSKFYGLQKQNKLITVQGEIERGLNKIFNQNIRIIISSRTDRKVHALDAYAHFDIDKEIDIEKTKYSMNRIINKSIYIKKIKLVSDEFHARYSVKQKEYLYIINMGEYDPLKKDCELQYNKNINVKLIKNASKYLIGIHNFRHFTTDSEKENYERKIDYIKIKQIKNKLYIYIASKGFLRYMVRNIVGLLLSINENKIKLKDINNIIKNGSNLFISASPEGLYLNKIKY